MAYVKGKGRHSMTESIKLDRTADHDRMLFTAKLTENQLLYSNLKVKRILICVSLE